MTADQIRHRCILRIAELGPMPRWWRPFKRRRWQRAVEALKREARQQIAEVGLLAFWDAVLARKVDEMGAGDVDAMRGEVN